MESFRINMIINGETVTTECKIGDTLDDFRKSNYIPNNFKFRLDEESIENFDEPNMTVR
jgi:hypothetical protein